MSILQQLALYSCVSGGTRLAGEILEISPRFGGYDVALSAAQPGEHVTCRLSKPPVHSPLGAHHAAHLFAAGWESSGVRVGDYLYPCGSFWIAITAKDFKTHFTRCGAPRAEAQYVQVIGRGRRQRADKAPGVCDLNGVHL